MEKLNPKIKKLYTSVKSHYDNKDFDKACIELNKIISIAKKKKLSETVEWAKENHKICRIQKIKNVVLELGTKFTRLEMREILEKVGYYKEEFVINIIEDMISKQEIHAEFFASTKAILFNQQANIDEIEKLMSLYNDWELEDNT